MLRLDRQLLVPNNDDRSRLEVGEALQDGGHIKLPFGEPRSHVGPLARVEFHFIG